ncbi:hypothetical protein [Halocynthiibacter namhaensis]|uniref:hypothetical protein n=1 Tax=Halocynthiibacter namhaensis TaxID=1290553 RepID=UPI001EE1955D|nr:hypothetical protein [Halocynthiibacter namhaensis]
MRTLTATCALLLALPSAGLAQSDEATPGRELSELIYGSIEDNPAGAADMGEFVNFGQDIFVSMGSDESGSIDLGEFTAWDFGFSIIAEDAGQERAYETAQNIFLQFGTTTVTARSSGVSIISRWCGTSAVPIKTTMHS